MKRIFLLAAAFFFAACPLRAETLFENALATENDLPGRQAAPGVEITGTGLQISRTQKGNVLLRFPLPAAGLSNRILRLSCEAGGEGIADRNTVPPYSGIKVQLELKTKSGTRWFDVGFPDGDFAWKRFETTVFVPAGTEAAFLNAGLQNTTGKLRLRNLKLESIGESLDFAPVANMALEDEVAGDGKGGWTDQGPEQDGRIFRAGLKRKYHGSIPISVATEGKSVLLMNSARFPSGPEQVELPAGGTRARTFYLMHTLAYVPKQPEAIGTITLTDEAGKQQKISVQAQRDVTDWFRSVVELPNAAPVVLAESRDKTPAAVYLSRFSVNPELGPITGVTLRTTGKAMWLILGATLSPQSAPLPVLQKPVMKANANWLPFPIAERNPIRPGSALDRSVYLPAEKAGESGRVIINPAGHFAFAKQPDRPVRFLTCSLSLKDDENLRDHQTIRELAEEIRRNGYNMVRLHFPDVALMTGSQKELEFNPHMQDGFDYLIYCLKENGIYLNLDLMSSWIGYLPGNPHDPVNADPLKSLKYRIHFEPAIREHWRKGVEKLVGHVNPYTKLRLADDPALAMTIGYNEQEYGFWRPFADTHILPRWRAFLQQRYGTIAKLREAWGEKAAKFNSFDDIPCFALTSRVYENDDVALFLREVETDTLRFYENTMRELGYPGPVTGYNCGKNQYYNMIRKDSPFVAMNAYHAHPSNWVQRGSSISQNSAIGERAKLLRDFAAVRQSGKPFVVTEHNLVFWNRYRYEQSFVMGAYSALQGFDALTSHGTPVSFRPEARMLSFGMYKDPIMKASELLTFLLFIRGDVATAPAGLRVQIGEQEVFGPDGLRGGMPTELSLSALVAGLSIDCLATGATGKSPVAGESVVKMGESSGVLVSNAGFSSTLDNPGADAKNLLNSFQEKKLLPADNRSDGKNVFESVTGEILLDASRNYMQIDTPRFQGICAEAGTQSELSDLSVESLTVRGVLALAGIDGLKPIREADRLILVYATNALNSNMSFTSPDMVTLHHIGEAPALLERGGFRIAIRHRDAGKLRLYPLDMAGNRGKEFRPVEWKDSRAVFQIDTGETGPAVFFEIQKAE